MADASLQAQTYNNSGSPVAYNTTNYGKHVINQADVGRELIVSAYKSGGLTDANITAIRNAITLSGGAAGVLPADTGDAFTVAAIGTAAGAAFATGSTETVYFRVQGTGTFDTTDAAGSTGATVAVVAVFAAAL